MISNYHGYYATNTTVSSSSYSPSPKEGIDERRDEGREEGRDGLRDEVIKTQFITREGIYKSQCIAEYIKIATRLPTSPGQASTNLLSPSVPVRVSMSSKDGENDCRIAFNIGRELFIYEYSEKSQSIDPLKPLDKRIYKGTYPTAHAFNKFIDSEDNCTIIIGFSAGQIQQLDPLQKDIQTSRLFNEDRLIDRTPVTCITWVPFEQSLFIVSHSSGNLYLYDTEITCSLTPPTYSIIKAGTGYTVYGNKNKENRLSLNPLVRWKIGKGSLHQFEFSKNNNEENLLLGTVSHDGFLRIFNYNNKELIIQMKSYFGGLLCLDWSPDNRYIATGGEDDMITVFNVNEGRIVARGQGHKSWISQIKFDHYMTVTEEEVTIRRGNKFCRTTAVNDDEIAYRVGSVGFDAHIALWEVTEEILTTPFKKNRQSIHYIPHQQSTLLKDDGGSSKKKQQKQHRKVFSFGIKSGKELSNVVCHNDDYIDEGGINLFGTVLCPKMDQVPIMEPMILKKISHDRLTSLIFRKTCMITGCQEGNILEWDRPI
uniref:AT02583p (inferred by orthology to a D. melanogaster protein) n=1 Tax=Strongyloides venezuelensis TaxID=75913 RepID=A0A0K0FIJ7_STRVS